MKNANFYSQAIAYSIVSLSMGHTARADFYQLLGVFINECATDVGKLQVLELSQILPPYFWDKINKWQKGIVGRCMAKMVREGMVGFRRISGKGTYKYQKI